MNDDYAWVALAAKLISIAEIRNNFSHQEFYSKGLLSGAAACQKSNGPITIRCRFWNFSTYPQKQIFAPTLILCGFKSRRYYLLPPRLNPTLCLLVSSFSAFFFNGKKKKKLSFLNASLQLFPNHPSTCIYSLFLQIAEEQISRHFSIFELSADSTFGPMNFMVKDLAVNCSLSWAWPK